MNRRRFLKYAGATAAVVGASALGLDYLARPSARTEVNQTTTTTLSASPVISNFQWQPTRVVNEKVYDATICLNIQSGTALTQLKATLDSYAPTIPARAYPGEPQRILQFTPSPITAGLYSAQVANLLGGKEYKLNVQATNLGGMQNADFETPYVREFENISGNDNVLVGTYYFPWFESPCTPGVFCHWGELGATSANPTTPNGTPLLGLYDSGDPAVISKHIDWVTGHGIDFLILDWWGSNGSDHLWIDSVNRDHILKHPMISQVAVSVMYESTLLVNDASVPIDFDNSSILAYFLNDMSYLAKNYLSHSNFLRVHNKPVIFLYAAQAYAGDISSAIAKARSVIESESGLQPYIVGLHDSLQNPEQNLVAPYDAACNWVNMVWHQSNIEAVNEIVTESHDTAWWNYAHLQGKEFIPSAIAGFRKVANLGGVNYPVLQKSPQRFAKQIQIAFMFLDSANKIMVIPTFNDWSENAQIEPSVEDGFTYLQTLKNSLAGQ